MKILLEVEDAVNKSTIQIEVDYNSKTTMKILLDENVSSKPALLSSEVISPTDNVDFYYHEGVLHWDTNIYDMLVIDFVDKFPRFASKIPICINFGGIGCAPHEIMEFSIELYKRINLFISENPLAVMLLGYTISSCKRTVVEWIKSKKDCVKFSSFKNSLYEKTTWRLKDLVKALEIDEKSAKIIMMTMGYKYNKKTKIFTLNKKIDN